MEFDAVELSAAAAGGEEGAESSPIPPSSLTPPPRPPPPPLPNDRSCLIGVTIAAATGLKGDGLLKLG